MTDTLKPEITRSKMLRVVSEEVIEGAQGYGRGLGLGRNARLVASNILTALEENNVKLIPASAIEEVVERLAIRLAGSGWWEDGEKYREHFRDKARQILGLEETDGD